MIEAVPRLALKHELWRRGDLSYKLWAQQLPIYHGIRQSTSDLEEVVILCARQFGKSHLGVLMGIEDCVKYPNSCILLVGPTMKQAVEIAAPRIKEISLDAPPGLVRRSKSESKWYIGSSELVIGGFDQNSSSQRGKTVQNIYIEEIVDSNPDDYVESMRSDLGPALTHSKNGKMVFLTTLPKIPAHPFIIDTIPKAKLNNAFYSYTIDDNKALTPAQYDACVRRCGGKDSVAFRREYLNEIIRDERTSLAPDFSEERHVRKYLGVEGHYHTFIDFGGVRDKTAALFVVYDFIRNKLLAVDERIFNPNTPTDVITKEIIAMEKSFQAQDVRRYADMPGQLQVDLGNSGFQVQKIINSDWTAAVNNMQVAFSLNEVEIDPKCRVTIQTMESGQFNKNKTDFQRTEALGHCDAAAAFMYAVMLCDRSNPFGLMPSGSNKFVRNSYKFPEAEVAAAMVPKSINNNWEQAFISKKFGKFRK